MPYMSPNSAPLGRRSVRAWRPGSIVDTIGPGIRELLQAYPRMPATVIAERIGWDRGLTVLFAVGIG